MKTFVLLLAIICCTYVVLPIHADDTVDEKILELESSQQIENGDDDGVWRELKPDETVPRGSHVRLDMTTGIKSVKVEEEPVQPTAQSEDKQTAEMETILRSLPEPDISLSQLDSSTLSPEEYDAAIKKIWESRQQFLKEAMENIQDEGKEMQKHISDVMQHNATEESTLLALDYLEAYVETIDNANDFYNMGGLEVCTMLLGRDNAKIRAAAAYVIGTAIKSHHDLQVGAQQYNVLGKILVALDNMVSKTVAKQDVAEGSKLLYVLGSLLRGCPETQIDAVESILPQLLLKVAKSNQMKLQSKVFALISDILQEQHCENEDGNAKVEMIIMTDILSGNNEEDKSCSPSPLAKYFQSNEFCEVAIAALDDVKEFDNRVTLAFVKKVLILTKSLHGSFDALDNAKLEVLARTVQSVANRFKTTISKSDEDLQFIQQEVLSGVYDLRNSLTRLSKDEL